MPRHAPIAAALCAAALLSACAPTVTARDSSGLPPLVGTAGRCEAPA